MKILIVAPADPKNLRPTQATELARIASGNEPIILSDLDATIAGFETALDKDQFEIVHIVAPGENRLLQMVDGPVGIDWLIRRLKAQRNLKLVFLNAFDSVEMGTEIHTKMQVITITMRYGLDDTVGMTFAIHFYGAVLRGASFNDAFYESRAAIDDIYPTSKHPLLLDGATMDQKRFQSEMVAQVALLTVNATDQKTAWEKLLATVAVLTDRVDWASFHRFQRIVVWVLALLTLVVILLVAVFGWQFWPR